MIWKYFQLLLKTLLLVVIDEGNSKFQVLTDNASLVTLDVKFNQAQLLPLDRGGER